MLNVGLSKFLEKSPINNPKAKCQPTMLFLFRLEDIENYFGCSAEFHEIIPSVANKDDLELIKTICAGARRGLYEFERDEYSSNNESDTSLSADTGQEALDNAFLIKSIEVGGFSFDLRSEPSAYEAISAIACKPEMNADGILVLPVEWDDDKDELWLP